MACFVAAASCVCDLVCVCVCARACVYACVHPWCVCVRAQVLAVSRDVDRRVLKLLVEWPEEEGWEMKATSSGQRLLTNIDVSMYLEGVTSLVRLRKQVACKSTETGTLANIKRALAVRVRSC